jgi:secreted trypsin-like serine protease
MERFLIILLILSVSIYTLNANLNVNNIKILSGYSIDITDAPFMAKIEVKFNQGHSYCGGSIIRNNFILTAAHCK